MDTYDPVDDKKNSRLYPKAWERFSAYKYLKNATMKNLVLSSSIYVNKKGSEKTNFQKQ